MLTGVPVLKVISSKCHAPILLTLRNIDTIQIAYWGTKHYAQKRWSANVHKPQIRWKTKQGITDSKGLCDGISAYFSLVSTHHSEQFLFSNNLKL